MLSKSPGLSPAAWRALQQAVSRKAGRNKDKRLHVLIIEIAKFFKLYLPNSAISKYPNTHFSRVVTYILTYVLDERYSEYKGPKDPERRIEDALKEFHARVN